MLGWPAVSAFRRSCEIDVKGKGHCVVTPSMRPAWLSNSMSVRRRLSPTSAHGEDQAREAFARRKKSPQQRRRVKGRILSFGWPFMGPIFAYVRIDRGCGRPGGPAVFQPGGRALRAL